jgi:hypothetical protein
LFSSALFIHRAVAAVEIGYGVKFCVDRRFLHRNLL